MGARRFRELPAEIVTDVTLQTALPLMDTLEQGEFAVGGWVRASELVRISHLAHELNRVIDPVNADPDRIDIIAAHLNVRVGAGSEGFAGGKREVRLPLILRSEWDAKDKNRGRSEAGRRCARGGSW